MNNKLFKVVAFLFLGSILFSCSDDNGGGKDDKGFEKAMFDGFKGTYVPTNLAQTKVNVHGTDVELDLTKSLYGDAKLAVSEGKKNHIRVNFRFYRKDVSSSHKDFVMFNYDADIPAEKKTDDLFEVANLGLSSNKVVRDKAFDKDILKNINTEMPNFIKYAMKEVLKKLNDKMDVFEKNSNGIVQVKKASEPLFANVTKIGYKLEFVKSDVAAKKNPNGVSAGKQAKVEKSGDKYKLLARIPFDVTFTLKGTLASAALQTLFDTKKFRLYLDFDATKE